MEQLGSTTLAGPGAGTDDAGATSPFAGGLRPLVAEQEASTVPASWLTSPFSEGLTGGDEPGSEAAADALLAELEDEEFDEAVDALVDAAAARHLASTAAWSSEASAPTSAIGEVEAWLAGLAGEADRALGHLEEHFGDRTPESLLEGEVEAAVAEAVGAGIEAVGEDFVRSLVRKAGKLASGVMNVARRGLAVAARLLPLGKLFGILRQLVGPLLKRVLAVAVNRLPPQYRGLAAGLTKRLTGESAEGGAGVAAEDRPLGELFDAQLAEAALAGDEATAEHLVAEAGAWPSGEDEDVVAPLDGARARLAEQLAAAEDGAAPVAAVQQFIPVVMAALPLVRAGVRVVGRDKVVGFVADQVAHLIKGHVGPDATKGLSRAIADTGLRLLSLEAEPEGLLGAEALVSAVEDTVRSVAALPGESQDQPLRLAAEVQEAFAEAVTRHVPARLLRADLDAAEAAGGEEGEAGVWVLMPRGPSRTYRYRAYTRVRPVRLRRRVARAIVLRDGATLERRLLDRGVRAWPVDAEVHLYETVPGTHLGHIAGFEGEDPSAAGDAGELEELTTETAALLLGEPGLAEGPADELLVGGPRPLRVPGAPLGGRPPLRSRAGGLAPGRRLFRVVVRGAPPRRRRPRVLVRLDVTRAQPTLLLHLRLSEREAHALSGLLARRAHVQVVAAVRRLVRQLAAGPLPTRVQRVAGRAGVTLTPTQAATLARAIGERIVTGLASQLPTMAPALATAAKDPARGLTLSFQVPFADRAALAAGAPGAPTLTVRAGSHGA
jgi:hypothetical protein